VRVVGRGYVDAVRNPEVTFRSLGGGIKVKRLPVSKARLRSVTKWALNLKTCGQFIRFQVYEFALPFAHGEWQSKLKENLGPLTQQYEQAYPVLCGILARLVLSIASRTQLSASRPVCHVSENIAYIAARANVRRGLNS